MNHTMPLCEKLASLRWEELPQAVKADLPYKLLDWTGCAAGALDKPGVRAVLEWACAEGGNPRATIIGIKEKSSSAAAAFCNGLLGHALEYDDVNKVSLSHPGAVVIPAALAASETGDKTFGEFASGVSAGYEAMIRIGAALNPSHYDHWHTTGTCGTFAAAAAAGRVMGLSAGGLGRAFGIAATAAGGLTGVFGTDAKLITVGNAARNGVLAAEFAARGFSAPDDGLGIYAKAASKEENLGFLQCAMGDPLMIEDAYYKIHASCGHTHSALDALALILKENPLKAEDVECITVSAYAKAVELTGRFQADTELQAKFSLPFCIAAMLLHGQLGIREFEKDIRLAPKTAQIAARITVIEDPAFTCVYPQKRPERVQIKAGGRTFEKTVELPDGRPEEDFLKNKFLSLCSMTLPETNARRIMDAVLQVKPHSSMTAMGDEIRRNCYYG
jgi:2-methylcitrate dehydratase PrpD